MSKITYKYYDYKYYLSIRFLKLISLISINLHYILKGILKINMSVQKRLINKYDSIGNYKINLILDKKMDKRIAELKGEQI